jgi:hypothetical protein
MSNPTKEIVMIIGTVKAETRGAKPVNQQLDPGFTQKRAIVG